MQKPHICTYDLTPGPDRDWRCTRCGRQMPNHNPKSSVQAPGAAYPRPPDPRDLPAPLYPCTDAAACGAVLPADNLLWYGGAGDENVWNIPGWRCTNCLSNLKEQPGDIIPGYTLADHMKKNFSAAVRTAGLIDRPFIYIASPFTPTGDDDENVANSRIEQAGSIAAMMIRAGIAGVAPIPFFEAGARAYHGDKLDPPEGYYDYDLRYLKRCDATIVIALSGWQKSTGVDIEVRESVRLGMPVRILDPDILTNMRPSEQDTLLLDIERSIIEQLNNIPKQDRPRWDSNQEES
ncbi:MAG: DUF1937 family protein [Dehalococcoidia bacterium]|nr:DUF1937 family protein [Dehalococcoidia bacterium]